MQVIRTENSPFKKGFHPIVSEAILGRGNKCLAVTRMGQVELTGWQNFWPRVRWSLLHERESAPPSISKPALVLLLLLIVCVQLFLGYRADRRDPNILFSPTLRLWLKSFLIFPRSCLDDLYHFTRFFLLHERKSGATFAWIRTIQDQNIVWADLCTTYFEYNHYSIMSDFSQSLWR